MPGGVTLPEQTRDGSCEVSGECPELTLQGTEAVSEYSRCRGEKALAELPAGGRGPWQQQFRAQEAGGQS